MKLDVFGGLRGIDAVLDYHLTRHSVLLSNLANSETPGYRPQDIVFTEVLEEASMPAPTHPDHIPIHGGDAAVHAYDIVESDDVQTGGDENGVRMERAMAEVAANRLRYDAAVEIAQRRMALLRYAATDGGS